MGEGGITSLRIRAAIFLRHNWLGLAGLIIGLFGILLSVYFYLESQVQREPILLFDGTRTEIISSRRASEAPIRVLKPDGSEVKSDLVAVRFYFWNQGRLSIRRENVLQPVTVAIADATAHILDARFLKVSREITRLAIVQSGDQPGRKIVLEFQILDHGDGGTGLIIYEGSPKAALEISGVIEGVSKIETNETLATRRILGEYFRGAGPSLLAIAGVVVAATIPSILVRLAPLMKHAPAPLRKLGSVVGTTLGVLLVAAVILSLLFVIIVEPVRTARARFQENVSQKVPPHLLPPATPSTTNVK
jgi:hypothetical protein